jgi:hypothetical protein
MTEKLILACLVLFLVQQTLAFLNDLLVTRRNFKVYEVDIKRAEERISRLESDLKGARSERDFYLRIAEKPLDNTAFAITTRGVCALPAGWERVTDMEQSK